MKISIVIAGWNEEKNIGQVVDNIKQHFSEAEIIVANDGSTDRTEEIAKEHGALVISHKINRGQGAALQTGNSLAIKHGADIIVHFDGDNQFLVKEIDEVIEPIIKNEADIVFGSRFLGKDSSMPKAKRKIIMPLARLFNKIFFGIKLSDPQCGFRAMTKETAQKIIIKNDRMAHCTEIMAKAHKYKLKIKEVPITVIYHEFGQSMSGGFSIIKDFIYKKLSN